MNDQRDLEGISALITGATSGIGRAAAEELGRQGAEIVVHGRDADRGFAVAGTITRWAVRPASWRPTSPARPRWTTSPSRRARSTCWSTTPGSPGSGRPRTFDRLFAANVRAAYFLVAALAPKMAARGSGSIISLGSMAGQIGLAGGAAYGATKATRRR